MELDTVEDLVDQLPLGPYGDSDEVELVGSDRGDLRAVRLVVAGREELRRVDRGRDAAFIARV